MTDKLAFRIAFFRQCAERGMTIKQAKDLLTKIKEDKSTLLKFASQVKKAEPDPISMLGSIAGGVGNAANAAVGGIGAAANAVGVPAIVAAGVAPPAIGYLGGKLMGKATDYDDTDVEEIKLRELIDEYRRSAQYLQNLDNKKQVAVKRTAIR